MSLADGVLELIRGRVEHAGRTEPDRVAKTYWLDWSQRLQGLSDHDIAALTGIDWSQYGQMRGLAAAIRQIIVFREDVLTVVARLPFIDDTTTTPNVGASEMYDRLLRRPDDGGSIAAHLRELALEDQRGLRRLLEDPVRRERIAYALGISEAKIRTQILDLGRSETARHLAILLVYCPFMLAAKRFSLGRCGGPLLDRTAIRDISGTRWFQALALQAPIHRPSCRPGCR